MQAWEEKARELIRQGRVTEAMHIAASAKASRGFDRVAMARERAERYNQRPGTLTGYDCPDCLNRGDFAVVDEAGNEFAKLCKCREVRNSIRFIEKSGLSNALGAMTFDAFRPAEKWQRDAMDMARRYADAVIAGASPWMFFGGQPGSGKTHLCTAACGKLLRAGIEVRYMVWPEAIDPIKACRFDQDAMDEMLVPFKQARVLYIDDLFKTAYRQKRDRQGRVVPPSPEPSDADVRICYEVLNARYFRRLPTILSCEWMLMTDLMPVDEATFSRAYERAKGFVFELARDTGKNYRLGAAHRS